MPDTEIARWEREQTGQKEGEVILGHVILQASVAHANRGVEVTVGTQEKGVGLGCIFRNQEPLSGSRSHANRDLAHNSMETQRTGPGSSRASQWAW